MLSSSILLLQHYNSVCGLLSLQYHHPKLFDSSHLFLSSTHSISCMLQHLPWKYELEPVHPLWQLEEGRRGAAGGRRAELGAGVWLVGGDVSGATSWSVCSLGGGEGDCGVVSLNKMAARPLSTRAH